MGVITLTLITVGLLPADAGPPLWVIATCGLAIALGTSLGGWRIIQTMGKRISEIQSPQGFAAETSSAAVILTSAHLGFALSTPRSAPARSSGPAPGASWPACGGAWPGGWRWPGCSPCHRPRSWAPSPPGSPPPARWGTIVVAVVAVAIAAGIYILSRRQPVNAENVNDVPEAAPVAVGV